MPTTHRVSQGECLSSIAARHGFTDWRAIYDHADNAALRKKRPNPNVLFPGDEVVIPDKVPKRIPCSTGGTQKVVVKRLKTRLRVQLCNGGGRPYAGKRYDLKVGGAVLAGTTDGSGMVDQPVPAHATAGELVVWPGDDPKATCRFKLALGALDPPEELTGAQARLANLGFAHAPGSGALDAPTRAALRAFQQAHGLEVSGALDAATSAKLRALHDE
jgi:N-acetylmuramoyl-L-alanine amidase